MKRSRFTEELIISILKEQQTGLGAAELCRRHGMSDATFYNWRSKWLCCPNVLMKADYPFPWTDLSWALRERCFEGGEAVQDSRPDVKFGYLAVEVAEHGGQRS